MHKENHLMARPALHTSAQATNRRFRTGAAALSLAAIAALGLSACGTQNTSNPAPTATATAKASSTADAAVNAGNGKVTVKASDAASPV